MKLYIFYHYDKKMDKDIYEELSRSGDLKWLRDVCACTTEKKHFKIYKRQRDMRKMVYLIKDVTKEEARYFINHHRSSLITVQELRYYPNKKSNMSKDFISVPVVCTEEEYERLSMEVDSSFICSTEQIEMVPFHKMNNKYKSILSKLEYDNIYALSYPSPSDDEEYPDTPNIKVDEFRVFVNLFMDAFK